MTKTNKFIYVWMFVICIIAILYKLYSVHLTFINYKYVGNYKYIYEIFEEKKEVTIKSENIEKLERLQSRNSDIVALIQIDGTNIDYPVLYSGDNSYYLIHNYKKELSKDGALMLDKDCNLLMPTTNILIYGHNNIGSNEMFSDLIKYKNKAFYEKHKTINFITNKEESVYEIICVFLSKVYYKSQNNVFKYYFFINAENKEQFDEFIANCKNLSIYEIDNTAVYGDELMTLSTCDYSRKNGRLAIVAKKIK